MQPPHGFVERRDSRQVDWVRQDLADVPAADWWRTPEPLPDGKGRGGVGTLQFGAITAVVRPYRRGGTFGKLLGDRYTGPSRATKELALLVAVRERGVPVVTPLAALARRRGAFWQLRLVTELEAGSLPLLAFVAAHPERRRHAALAAATAVRLAFAAGLQHPDLHPDNILVAERGDSLRVVLIDLDRAKLGDPIGQRQADPMLVRMARYLHKHAARLASRVSCADQLRFLRGLGLDRDQRREALLRLRQKLRRALALRARSTASAR